MRKLYSGIRRTLVGVILLAMLFVLAFAVGNTYDVYTQIIVEQQQQHLLIAARAVSQNLSLYISEQIRDVEILTKTPGFLSEFQLYYDSGEVKGLKEYLLSYMLSQHQGISRIYLLDQEGNEIYHYNQYPFLEEFDENLLRLEELCQRRQSGMGTVFRITPQHYGFTLVNGIMSGNEYIGTVVSVMDMQSLHQQFVVPLDIQNTGNIIVKNEKGTIIMHPQPEMLTFNARRDIPELDALPQYESLYAMLEKQYAYEEGTAIYRSYSNGILPPEDKICAFSRMNFGGVTWYVSAVEPYSQVKNLVDSNISRFVLLVTAILSVVAVGVMIIFALWKNRQKLQMETSYLREINRTLEELQQSREQVRHYQKLQTIGALASGIVHEFNNLLTPIMGYSEFIRERIDEGDPYYEDLDEIYKAGVRAKEIVEQILPFSRKETDPTAYRPVNLDTILRDCLKMIQMVLPSTITMDDQVTSLHANVFGSATQLHQAFLNLCSNAYQAMEQGGGVLTVLAQRVTREALPEGYCPIPDSEYALIRISDTGCGIPPENLSHIFDPFFTTKEAGQGTGLGLSVVQNILISHNGFIQVESVPGQGSRFSVYLPITEIPAVKAAHAPSPAEVPPDAGALMVVDDNPRVARYLKRRLVSRGYQVDMFTDPELAMREFSRDPKAWDLVIADDTMPKYRGTVLIPRMKSENPTLSAILITGLVERDAIRLQNKRVIDDILIKPLDFDQLLERVEQLLGGKRPI